MDAFRLALTMIVLPGVALAIVVFERRPPSRSNTPLSGKREEEGLLVDARVARIGG